MLSKSGSRRDLMMRCNSCGGTYQPIQADGTEYYHSCPLLPPTADAPEGRERPNKRDESPVAHATLFVLPNGDEVVRKDIPSGILAHRKVTIRSEGLGASPVADQPTRPQTTK